MWLNTDFSIGWTRTMWLRLKMYASVSHPHVDQLPKHFSIPGATSPTLSSISCMSRMCMTSYTTMHEPVWVTGKKPGWARFDWMDRNDVKTMCITKDCRAIVHGPFSSNTNSISAVNSHSLLWAEKNSPLLSSIVQWIDIFRSVLNYFFTHYRRIQLQSAVISGGHNWGASKEQQKHFQWVM